MLFAFKLNFNGDQFYSEISIIGFFTLWNILHNFGYILTDLSFLKKCFRQFYRFTILPPKKLATNWKIPSSENFFFQQLNRFIVPKNKFDNNWKDLLFPRIFFATIWQMAYPKNKFGDNLTNMSYPKIRLATIWKICHSEFIFRCNRSGRDKEYYFYLHFT